MSLERVRFEDRLLFERTLDPGALEARVPPMLVQTLVENAVKHGVAALPQGGVVRVRAAVDRPRMTISVSNSGTMRRPTTRTDTAFATRWPGSGSCTTSRVVVADRRQWRDRRDRDPPARARP